MANVHPWFANVSATEASDWTANFFATTDVAAAEALSNNPAMYIAETGWPTVSSSFTPHIPPLLLYIAMTDCDGLNLKEIFRCWQREQWRF